MPTQPRHRHQRTSAVEPIALLIAATSLLMACGDLPASSSGEPTAPIVVVAPIYEARWDIAYAEAHPLQRLDIYVPKAEGTYPLIIWIPGEDYRSGDKATEFPEFLFDLAGADYAVASVGYRFSDTSFPTTISDIRLAVRFLRANATEFRLDPDAFGVIGYAGGGHLAALTATAPEILELDRTPTADAALSTRVQAAVAFSSPHNLHLSESSGLPAEELEAIQNLLDCYSRGQACMDRTALASPVTHVDSSDAPLLLIHGEADSRVPWEQSLVLHEEARLVGLESRLVLIADAEHGKAVFEASELADVRGFLDRHLR